MKIQLSGTSYINNLREKFSPGLGFEPGSPALRAGAIITNPPRRSTGPSRNSSLIGSPLPSGSTHFTYSLRTDFSVSCKEYCKRFEINTARHFKYRKQKTQPYLQSETLFLSITFRGLLNIFCKLPDQS